MAIDLTSGAQPAFAAISDLTTACVQIRVPPHTRVAVKGNVGIYVFNGVDDGGEVASAASRISFAAAETMQAPTFTAGGAIPGQVYATVCVAAQSGSSHSLEAWTIPPEREAP